MIVKMKESAGSAEIGRVQAAMAASGLEVHLVDLPFGRFVVGLGQAGAESWGGEALPGVEWAERDPQGPVLAALERNPSGTAVPLGPVLVGGERLAIIAGPCSVEDGAQLIRCARYVAACGATALRGGAFKPRTSPYSFQGLGREGLSLLAEAGRATHLAVVTEVMEPGDVEAVASFADCLQIGARSMQNYPLLTAAGKSKKPILLKRGPSASLSEFILAAEYILLQGNPNVILCERGIRTFETSTRNTLDLNAVPVLKSRTHLPVVVDPSHGTGRQDAVIPMARAAIAAGADGLIVEVHPDPEHALSDGDQSLTLIQFKRLVEEVQPVAEAVGRTIERPDAPAITGLGGPKHRMPLGWGEAK